MDSTDMSENSLYDALVQAEEPYLSSAQKEAAPQPPKSRKRGKKQAAPEPTPAEDAIEQFPEQNGAAIGEVPRSDTCLVCEEAQPSVFCSRADCSHAYHRECLPELRKPTFKAKDWVCPPCRHVYNLGPVCPLDLDDDVSAALAPVSDALHMAAYLVRATGRAHEDKCHACGAGGDMILCDGPSCTRAYHAQCTPDLRDCAELPEGDWFCPNCSGTAAAASQAPIAPLQAPIHLTDAATHATESTEPSTSAAPSANGHQPESGGHKLLLPFDDALERQEGTDEWAALVQKIRDDKEKKESRHPPKFRRVTKNLYRISKASLRQSRKTGRAGMDDEDFDSDRCNCAELKTGCKENCVNRLLYAECTRKNCSYGEDEEQQCHNRTMQRKSNRNVEPRPTPGKGWGLFAVEDIPKGEFIIEYCGEIIDDAECERRMAEHKASGQVYFHMLEISRDLVIDAGYMGNDSRFINHSCAPNCSAEKRRVGDDTRVGIFAKEDIAAGMELTYDYQFITFAEERWECQCGEPTCRKYLGVNKREAMDAAALARAGVHRELKKAVFADDSNGDSPQVGRKGGFATGRPIKASLSMGHLNPTVFYDHKSPLPSTPSVLTQLQEAGLAKREREWVRQQRIFLLGRPAKTPNPLDDGAPPPTSAARQAPAPAPVPSAPAVWAPLVGKAGSRPVTTKRGFNQGKLGTILTLANDIKEGMRAKIHVHTGMTQEGNLAQAVAQGKICGSAADSACELVKAAWDAVVHDDTKDAGAPTVGAIKLRMWSDTDFLKRLEAGTLTWASSVYLMDADVNSGFHQVGSAADGNDVLCSKCLGSGDLLCCDGCPRAYHLSCINMSVYDVPQGRWLCSECKKASRTNRRAISGTVGTASSSVFPQQDADAMLLFASLAPQEAALVTSVRLEATPQAGAGSMPDSLSLAASQPGASPVRSARSAQRGPKRSRPQATSPAGQPKAKRGRKPKAAMSTNDDTLPDGGHATAFAWPTPHTEPISVLQDDDEESDE